MDVSLSEFRELLMGKEAWRAVIHGVAKIRHDWVTELNWTEPYLYANCIFLSYLDFWDRSQQATKKESERKIAESKQVLYILEISKLQKLQ